MTELIHLKAIEQHKFEDLHKRMNDFALAWNYKRSCVCCKDLVIVNDYTVKICEHVEKAIEKKFGNELNKNYALWCFIKNCEVKKNIF